MQIQNTNKRQTLSVCLKPLKLGPHLLNTDIWYLLGNHNDPRIENLAICSLGFRPEAKLVLYNETVWKTSLWKIFILVFFIHLGLSEPSAAHEMKKHLVWFADLSYNFCVSIFKKVFFRAWLIDVSIWWSWMQQCKAYHVHVSHVYSASEID